MWLLVRDKQKCAFASGSIEGTFQHLDRHLHCGFAAFKRMP
jgi:hypothetical protein